MSKKTQKQNNFYIRVTQIKYMDSKESYKHPMYKIRMI